MIPKEPYHDLLTRVAKLREQGRSPSVVELDGLTDALHAQLLRGRIDGNDADAVAFAEILGETVMALDDRFVGEGRVSTFAGGLALAVAAFFRGVAYPWSLVVALLFAIAVGMAGWGISVERKAAALKRLNVAITDLRRQVMSSRAAPRVRIDPTLEATATVSASGPKPDVARSSTEEAAQAAESERKKPP